MSRPKPRARHPRAFLTLTALEARAVPAVAYAVTPGNALLRFDTGSPGVIQRSVPLAGLQGGDRVVGIDVRARTGQLYAVAVRDTPGPDEGRAYRVDPGTGACTPLGGPFSTTLADGASYGVEVDPVRDTLRVVNGAGQNLEVSVTDGSLLRTGTALHYGDGTAASVTAIAYTGGLNPGTHATLALAGIDTATASVVQFGGLTSDEDGGLVHLLGPLGVTPAGGVAFDYLRVPGEGYAAIPTASGTGLYRVNLGGSAATLIGAIGGTTAAGLSGFALALPTPLRAAGAGPGGGPQVNLYASDGTPVRSFNAYDPAFRGGVRVAVGDLTGDGTDDVVTAPGPGGGPVVRVWDGATGALVREFSAYDPAFRGGVSVALGDVTGDGVPDIVTGAGAGGGPHVRVFDGATGAVTGEWMAYDPAFRGGVSVAVGNVSGDGRGEVISGAGPGGGPHVKVFNGLTEVELSSFLAYDPAFTGGVHVAAGDLLGGGGDQIITAPGAGGGPDVRVFAFSVNFAEGPTVIREFLAYAPDFHGGVSVAVANPGSGGRIVVLTGGGPGGGPHVREFDGPFLAPGPGFLAYDPAFTGGVFVG